MADNDSESEYMTVYEAAEALGVSHMTIRKRIWEGKLPAKKIGPRIRIRRADLDKILEPYPTGDLGAGGSRG